MPAPAAALAEYVAANAVEGLGEEAEVHELGGWEYPVFLRRLNLEIGEDLRAADRRIADLETELGRVRAALEEERRVSRATMHRLDAYLDQVAVVGRQRGVGVAAAGGRPVKFMCMVSADTPAIAWEVWDSYLH